MLTKALIVLALATLATSAIPPGYKEYPGVGHYKLYSNALSFGAAWKTCKDEGSNLVVVNSQRELNAIKDLYAANPSLHYVAWAGVHDMFYEGEFTTVLGYPLSMAGLSTWRSGEPNNFGGNENCVTIHRDGLLNDDVCTRTFPFFCEA